MKPARHNSTLVHNNMYGYRGVEFSKLRGRFRARIEPANGKRGRWLGYHDTAEDAGLAYDAAARKVYGKTAFLNFPERGERGVIPSRIQDGLCPQGHDLKQHGYVRLDGRGVTCRKCNSEANKRCYRKRRSALSLHERDR